MPKGNIERRRAPRADVTIPIHLSPRGDSHPATLTNLSTSGLCCTFHEAVSEMTLLGIEVDLPGTDSRARMQGAVVRCDKVPNASPATYEIGVFFTEMSTETRRALGQFMEAQVAAQIAR